MGSHDSAALLRVGMFAYHYAALRARVVLNYRRSIWHWYRTKDACYAYSNATYLCLVTLTVSCVPNKSTPCMPRRRIVHAT